MAKHWNNAANTPASREGASGATDDRKRERRLHMSTVWVAISAFAVCAFAFTFAFTIAWGGSVDRLAQLSSTDVFKTMDLETLDGERFTSENLKDAKLTLFNVWGTSCSPCILEMPALEELGHSYPEGTIQVVGIVSNATDQDANVIPETVEEAKAIVERAGVTFPSLLMDGTTYAFVKTNIIGTPTTYIVNQDGEIVYSVTGSQSFKDWKAIVDQMLASL